MPGFRRNLRIDARSAQAERSMNRIVVTMNQIVNDTRMPQMLWKNLFEHRGGAHVSGEVAPVLRSSQDGECVECSGIDIFGKLPVQFREHGFVTTITLFLRAITEENFEAL